MPLMTYREANHAKWVGTRPAHYGAQIVKTKDADNATVTVYTVTAGHILHLCGINFLCYSAAVGRGFMQWRSGAVAIHVFSHFRIITAVGASPNCFQSFWPPMEIPAGDIIEIASANLGFTVTGDIFGWEEPV